MKQYLEALQLIVDKGIEKKTRNAVTKSIFAHQMRFDMSDGFPAVTTKKLAFKSVVSELLWFLEGSNDERRLCEIMHGTRDADKTTIWTANAKADYWLERGLAESEGDLGRVYGVQWRNWINKDGDQLDQIKQVVERLAHDPNDRRLVVSAWNPGELNQMALPPCHMIFQFYVAEEGLSLHMYQRSCDMLLGVPFNIASYSLLLKMVAQVTGLEARELILTLGDAHIYEEHYEAVAKQLKREPGKLPDLWMNPDVDDIFSFTMEDFRLENYEPQETIKAEMIV